MKALLLATTLLALTHTAWAQAVTTTPESMKWQDNPALPKGGQGVVLVGDPTKAGEAVVYRVKFPANYLIPPHTHGYAEAITVISGNVGFGLGEKADKTGAMLKAGTFITNPAQSPHYVWSGDEGAVIQVQYIGPAGITYLDPKDDPHKK